MAITVDSSQWTGQSDDKPPAVPVVWGEFADEAARDAAMAQLRAGGARDEVGATEAATPEAPAMNDQVDPPDEHPEQADRRNQRQLGVGTAMAATSMAAAGIVIASGGALLPAIAAAAAAGAGTGAVGEAVANAVAPAATETHEPPPDAAGPVIGLRAPDDTARRQAEEALQALGAQRIFVQEAG
ncbi:hypothetical protein [Falsiroseomonas sp.]|uniref:hypothetical protein n=1 Tax=Falsiroseomonas sp. TaxID=2870721 RepID=UPI003F6E533F